MKSTHFRRDTTWWQEAFRLLYSVLICFAIPFAMIHLLIKGNPESKGSPRRYLERLGLVASPPKQDGLLFHCVSVGEVMTASCLIKQILQNQPDKQITVTTTTATASARVNDLFGDRVHHFYLPYDLPLAMNSMLHRVKPSMVLITEVELWPNLIHTCWRRAIPVVVVNARMTDRSANRYRKFPVLFTPMVNKISHVCAQGERDFKNYQLLGVGSEKLTLTQNIKFDQAATLTTQKQDFLGLATADREVLIAGSTHDPEEVLLLNVYRSLKRRHPSLLLILVPRHPERFESVAKMVEKSGLILCRSADKPIVDEICDVLLVNEMGKLNAAYDVSDIAFVGGSIAQRGGHNALEPAAKQLPILMGPSTHNNPGICNKLVECGALYIVENEQAFINQVSSWLAHPHMANAAGMAGYSELVSNSGALDKTLNVVHRYARQ